MLVDFQRSSFTWRSTSEKVVVPLSVDNTPDILHHSQQDLKNRVYQRIIKAFRLQQLQETRFFALVQDMRHRTSPPTRRTENYLEQRPICDRISSQFHS
jgi:hypothetical protein